MEIKTDSGKFVKFSNLTKIGISYDMNLQVGFEYQSLCVSTAPGPRAHSSENESTLPKPMNSHGTICWTFLVGT